MFRFVKFLLKARESKSRVDGVKVIVFFSMYEIPCVGCLGVNRVDKLTREYFFFFFVNLSWRRGGELGTWGGGAGRSGAG